MPIWVAARANAAAETPSRVAPQMPRNRSIGSQRPKKVNTMATQQVPHSVTSNCNISGTRRRPKKPVSPLSRLGKPQIKAKLRGAPIARRRTSCLFDRCCQQTTMLTQPQVNNKAAHARPSTFGPTILGKSVAPREVMNQASSFAPGIWRPPTLVANLTVFACMNAVSAALLLCWAS